MATSLNEIHEPRFGAYEVAELRLLYQLYEEAQRTRIAHGERLRAIFQGRSLAGASSDDSDADGLLKEIALGVSVGAPQLLERAYARAKEDELSAAGALRESISDHPAWPWLMTVKGVGHLLAARLLSRLDIARAATPSAFWAYCGLATIPGVSFKCGTCGLEIAYPLGYAPSGPHQKRSGAAACTGMLAPAPGAGLIRVAPRRTALGGRSGYDARARESCYLVGMSMLRCGSEYREFYDAEREKLATSRPGWTPKRCHLSAMRKMEKTFLRDLWIAWRRAAGLPIVGPYVPRPDQSKAQRKPR
ncbi:MAG TPA: transposase [Gemmatimonadaceae bacterium]|jgi:hypothetical protein